VSTNHWPDTTRVEHGDFTFDLARAAVRNVRYKNTQMIDLLYTAIRPWDWSTLNPDEHSEDVKVSGDVCVITIKDVFAGALDARTEITVSKDNKFTVAYELRGLAEYSVNRWGICFCLNSANWMGSTVHSQGNDYKLPAAISPQRVVDGITQGLFPAANQMHFVAPDNRSIKVNSTGKVLEAEDQRNWTDNTYKIYSGSLSEPRPFIASAGSVWSQSVTFEIDPPSKPVPDGSKIEVKEIDSLPSIGLQFNTDSLLPSDALNTAFILLDIDHIRINEESLNAQKVSNIAANGLTLEAALLSSHSGNELHRDIEHLNRQIPTGSRILIQREGREIVEEKDLPLNKSLSSFIPGTDAYLVDLHRNKYQFGRSISYSMVPTVHSSDTETIFKTLYTQAESISFAQEFLAPQVLISPITFSTRGNPETGHSRDQRINFANPEMALRIKTIEGAAWTLGSIFALASAGAYSGTWHELFGEYGVIYSESDAVKFSPTFHALSALGAHHAHQITIATSLDNSWVAFENHEAKKIVVASLRPWALEITPKVLAGYKTLQSLRASECEKASQIMDWWSYAEITPISADSPLTLTPFEIAIIRG
jgi:D-apionolactonase